MYAPPKKIFGSGKKMTALIFWNGLMSYLWMKTIKYMTSRISPTTRDDVSRCPWLRKLPGKNKYLCRIQDMKPEHCREYPLSREHAEETNCPGFE